MTEAAAVDNEGPTGLSGDKGPAAAAAAVDR